MIIQFGQAVTILFLGILSFYDIKWKKIPISILIIYGLVSSALFVIRISARNPFSCFSILFGILMLLAAFLTDEKIGYGDGIVLVCMGLTLEDGSWVFVIIVSTLASGLYGLYRLVVRRTEVIPYIPFLLLGMEVYLLNAIL